MSQQNKEVMYRWFDEVENGRITEAWNNFDFLKMNKQLGVL